MVDVERILVHSTFLLCEKQIFARVELTQVVHLDDADERLCISGAGGIACSLQSMCPSSVVGNFQAIQSLVTPSLEKERVILETLSCTLVFAEFLVGCIIVAQDIWSCPCASTFDSKVIVRFCCQCASSCRTLQQSLCQGDAGRYVVAFHLLNGPVFVFVDVSPVCLVGSLCHQRKATAYEKEQSG